MLRGPAVLCAIALIACAAACTREEPAAIPTPTGTPSSASPPAPTRTTPTTPPLEPEDACGGNPFNPKKVRAYNADGPPYAGRGIHLAELVNLDFADRYTELPRDWNARLTSTPGKVQLLICEWRDETFRSKTVDTCRYESTDDTKSTARSASARYRYRVFEARTGRQVTTFTLLGSLSGCPASTAGGVSEEYYERVADEDLAARLRPYVVGPARR